MITNVDVPKSLYQQLESIAKEDGISVPEAVLDLVRIQFPKVEFYEDGTVKLPIIHSRRPGSLRITNQQINEMLFP